jgi:phosphoribosylamine--glycine ligase
LKADGLCAGKGVFICADKDELLQNARSLFEENLFGQAGQSALLEQFMPGDELSVFVLTNGFDYKILPLFRDHKRLLDCDQGPNTGGMGVIGPIEIDKKLLDEIEVEIVRPTIAGFKHRGFAYRGVVFIGVMLTESGPSVLEYNVRFGDPETQCLMPVIDGDIAKIFLAIAKGEMPEVSFTSDKVACVVMACPGYPEDPKMGDVITGDREASSDSQYFLWAGVAAQDNAFITAGGRVANAIGVGDTLKQALDRAYAQVQLVSWPGIQFRKDIGLSTVDPTN